MRNQKRERKTNKKQKKNDRRWKFEKKEGIGNVKTEKQKLRRKTY